MSRPHPDLTPAFIAESQESRREPSTGGAAAWSRAMLIVLAFFVFRVLYLAFLSRWELVGDEAHYWEWSRRPDLSYYTKGPGIAWVIGLSTAVFGDVAAAVRLPSAIASAVMALAGSRLAHEITGRAGAAAWCAAVTLCLAPAYVATSQLATTDVFYSAAWMVAALCFWRAIHSVAGARRWPFWLASGAAIGVGCLFKYTALLELLGIAAFLTVQRRWSRGILVGIAWMLLATIVVSSPMLIWNAQHGWPTIAHQIGRLRLPGGDESVSLNWSPLWFPEFAGAQLALLGVVGAALVVMSIRRSRDADGTVAVGRSMLLWLAVPILAFYFVLSLFREAQGNWAIAAYTTPLVLVGIDAAATLRQSPRPRFQALWHWFLGIGVVVAIILLIGPSLIRVPAVAKLRPVQRLEQRVNGASARAALVDDVLAQVQRDTGRRPFVIAKGYQEASLLAFYLRDRPRVCCAASGFGSRPNAYDYFADTDLADAGRFGQDAVLVGASAERWREVLHFDIIEPSSTPAIFIGRNYRGPAAQHASRGRL